MKYKVLARKFSQCCTGKRFVLTSESEILIKTFRIQFMDKTTLGSAAILGIRWVDHTASGL